MIFIFLKTDNTTSRGVVLSGTSFPVLVDSIYDVTADHIGFNIDTIAGIQRNKICMG